MDYREEQKNELEALESIYFEEFNLLSDDPVVFSISVKSDVDGSGEEIGIEGFACALKITYTTKYPDTLPQIEIIDSENLTDTDEEDLLQCVTQYGKENLGMAMVFSLVSCAQEWLNNKYDHAKKHQEEAAEKRLREAEEEERKRFEGTRVTVEAFMAWKRAFEEELGITKKKEKDTKKLTGRELFMQDQTLNESDLKFLVEGGDPVTVDESLFQDLDDLGLEDEISDDE